MSAGQRSRRQECLQEMGIQRWYPRFVFPYGPAPVLHRVAERVEERIPPDELQVGGRSSPDPVPTPAPAAPVAPAPAAADTDARSSASDTAPATADATAPAPKPAPAPAATPAPAPHFAFAYLPVSDDLGVVVEVPYASRGRLQMPHRNLLYRILGALSMQVESGATPVVHFQWPLHEGDHLENTLQGARETVLGFLGKQLKDRPVRFLLAFCDAWPEYLFASDIKPTKGLLAHPLPVQVLVTHSLQQMLDDENLKRPVWSQLQQLKARLSSEQGNPS